MTAKKREKPTRVLITGGTGSFGKTMLRNLLEDGIEDPEHVNMVKRALEFAKTNTSNKQGN